MEKSAGQLDLENCKRKVAREIFITGFLWVAGFTESLLGPVKRFGVELALATGEGRRETSFMLPSYLRSF